MKKYKLIDNIFFSIGMLYRKNKAIVWVIALGSIVETLIPFVTVYFPKYVIEQLTQHAEEVGIIYGIAVFALATGGLYFIDKYLSTKMFWCLIVIQAEYIWDLYMKSLTCSYEFISTSKGQSLCQRAKESVCQGDLGCIRTMIPSILNFFVGFLGASIYGVLLVRLNVWILILAISLSVPGIILSMYINRYENTKKENWNEVDKRINYFINKSTEPAIGKDIRVFSMVDWVSGIIGNLLEIRKSWYNRVESKKCMVLICNSLVLFVRDSVTYIYLIWAVLNRYIDVGDFIFYFGIVSTFSQWTNMIVDQVSKIGLASNLVSDFRRFIDIPDDASDSVQNKEYKELDSIKSVEFKNVCYSYDGQNNIIDGISLRVNENESVGLVGINGAGKTTFIKLLCGLYKPTYGEILINDSPMSDYRMGDIFNCISTVFQDSSIFPFTVAENVTMKSGENEADTVNECIEKADLMPKVKSMYDGVNSEMLKITDDRGVYLSGGEMQKLYLARALYKDGSLLILDEPTSALDPISEKNQYVKYKQICRNKIAFYITHRVSSVSFCDRIVYMENGKIAESGTHDELMSINGKYAEMFNTQSKYYV